MKNDREVMIRIREKTRAYNLGANLVRELAPSARHIAEYTAQNSEIGSTAMHCGMMSVCRPSRSVFVTRRPALRQAQ